MPRRCARLIEPFARNRARRDISSQIRYAFRKFVTSQSPVSVRVLFRVLSWMYIIRGKSKCDFAETCTSAEKEYQRERKSICLDKSAYSFVFVIIFATIFATSFYPLQRSELLQLRDERRNAIRIRRCSSLRRKAAGMVKSLAATTKVSLKRHLSAG